MTKQRSNSWFDISNAGWKRLNAGRSLGHLVREAISNVFDAEGVTRCDIIMTTGVVQVEDDCPTGIVDKNLVTTVFLTDKEDSHLKRGRKGRGLKELIAGGTFAFVDTTGYRVNFNEDGSRDEHPSLRACGTMVRVENKEWDWDKVKEAIEYVRCFMPPDHIAMTLNGIRIYPVKIRARYDAHLQTTIIKDGKQIEKYADTVVLVRNLRKGQKDGWIYEMGIPVEKVGMKFNVDVQQRIPMNDNRDVINHGYLPELGGQLLNGMIDTLSKPALKDIWVLDSIPHANLTTKRAYTAKLVPLKHVIKTDSKRANDVCKQNGFELVDISNLPWGARNVLMDYGETATGTAEQIDRSTPIKEVSDLRHKYRTTVRLYEWFCGQLTGDRDYYITFMSKPRAYTGMMTLADHSPNVIRFNMESDLKLDAPLDAEMLATLVHELGHREERHEHDETFHSEVERLGGRLASLMFRARTEIEDILGNKVATATGAKLVPITCARTGCKEVRMVKPQDVFQVKFCVDHQKEAVRERAKLRRRMARED